MTDRSLSDQALQPPFTQPTCTPQDRQNVDTNTTTTGARAPSAGWLRNPAWIDGGVNPPHYYYSHEEIEAACRTAGVEPPPRYTQPENPVGASQLARDVTLAMGTATGIPLATQYDVLSARISPTPIPANSHYCPVGPPGNHTGNEVQAAEGHLVNVTHIFTATEPPTGSSRTMKAAAPKKKQTTMLGHITL